MKKISFISYSLGNGGAERVLALIANELSIRGYKVEIILFSNEVFYKIEKNITIKILNLSNISCGFFDRCKNSFRRIKALKECFKRSKSDIYISFLTHINILTIVAGFGYKKIITEHNIINKYRLLMFIFYRFSNLLICVSNGVKDNFSFLDKKITIYNPYPNNIEKLSDENLSCEDDFILHVGRLEEPKNQKDLINAYAKLKTNYKLLILGDGSLKDELKDQIFTLGLENRVFLKGAVKNPFPYYKKAKFFVLSSYSEGFGNVLVEALACGCPLVSYDCKSGPSEIIIHNKNGLLVEDQNRDKLTLAMQNIIDNENLRQNMKKEALKSREKFNLQKIVNQYENAISKVLKHEIR